MSLRDREVLDRVADFDATLFAGGRRHDFLQLHDRLRHREVERRRLAVEDADRLLLLLIADADHADFGGAGRHAGGSCICRPVRSSATRLVPSKNDAGFLKRSAAGLRGHGTGERTLRASNGGSGRQQRGRHRADGEASKPHRFHRTRLPEGIGEKLGAKLPRLEAPHGSRRRAQNMRRVGRDSSGCNPAVVSRFDITQPRQPADGSRRTPMTRCNFDA